MASELQERFRMKMEEKLKGCADQDTVKGIMDRGTRLRPAFFMSYGLIQLACAVMRL